MHPSGVKSYNAIDVGERYHAFLQKIYPRVCKDSPNHFEEQLLSLRVKTCNHTQGKNGLIPTLLVFGVLPRQPLLPHTQPNNVSRMKMMIEDCKKAAKLIVSYRINIALR